jgi:molecular chaperone DnaJ
MGGGTVQREKTLEIKIPAGVDIGSRLRIQGEGESGVQGGPPGDLYVVISVEEHPFFKREENNIYCEIPISIPQAVLGTEVSVPTLDGEEKLSIPEGTQTGTVFRMRGKGISSLNGHGKGDQFVAVNVRSPKKLSKEERRLYEELARLNKEQFDYQDKTIFNKVKDIFS